MAAYADIRGPSLGRTPLNPLPPPCARPPRLPTLLRGPTCWRGRASSQGGGQQATEGPRFAGLLWSNSRLFSRISTAGSQAKFPPRNPCPSLARGVVAYQHYRGARFLCRARARFSDGGREKSCWAPRPWVSLFDLDLTPRHARGQIRTDALARTSPSEVR